MFVSRREPRLRGPETAADGRVGRADVAFTLIELLVAMGIAFTVLGTLAFGYIQSYRITDSAMLQEAAQQLAVDRLEQVRSAEWVAYGTSQTNKLPWFEGQMKMQLEVPSVSTNKIDAWVTTAVTWVGNNPPLQRIDVVCLWTNLDGQVYTNAVSTLRAPN